PSDCCRLSTSRTSTRSSRAIAMATMSDSEGSPESGLRPSGVFAGQSGMRMETVKGALMAV
ncbi:hypothetical protein AB0H73_06795, partial [Streptomyces olivoreticuli]